MWTFRKSTEVINEQNTVDLDPEQYSQTSVLDRAMALPVGVGLRLTFATFRDAYLYRNRLYHRRHRFRTAARRLPADDAAFGRSPWDDLALFQPPGCAYIVVTKAPPAEASDRSHTRSDRKHF